MFHVGDPVLVNNDNETYLNLVNFSIAESDAKYMLGKSARIIEVREYGDILIYKLKGADFKPGMRDWYVHLEDITLDNGPLDEFKQLMSAL